MPLKINATSASDFERYNPVSEKVDEPIGLIQQMGAAFATGNITAAAIGRVKEGAVPLPDYGFRLADHLTDEELLAPERFAGARSVEELAIIRKRQEKLRDYSEMLDDGPLPAWLAMGIAGVIDLPTLLPVGGAVAGAGRGLGRAAATAAALGAADAGGSTALLQRLQGYSDYQELALTTLLGAGLGGSLGAAGYGVSQALRSSAREAASLLTPEARDGFLASLGVEVRGGRFGLTAGDAVRVAEAEPPALRVPEAAPTTPSMLRRAVDELEELQAGRATKARVPAAEVRRIADLRKRIDDAVKATDALTPSAVRAAREAGKELEGIKKAVGERARGGFVTPSELRRAIADADPPADRRPAPALERLEEEDAIPAGPSEQASIYFDRADLAKTRQAVAEGLQPVSTRLVEAGADPKVAREAIATLQEDIVAASLARGNGVPLTEDIAAAVARVNRILGGDLKGSIDTAEAAGSVGAAVHRRLRQGSDDLQYVTDDLTEVVGQDTLEAVGRRLGRLGLASPAIQLGASKFSSIRRWTNQLVHTGLITRGEKIGIRTGDATVEGRAKRANGVKASVARVIDLAWRDSGLSRTDFDTALRWALSNGDKHANPVVQRVAVRLRSDVLEPLRQDLVDAGIFKSLPGAPKNQASYFMRSWDHAAISRDPAGFRRVVARWVRRTDPGADETKALEVASDVQEQILGGADGRIPYITASRRGAEKARTFDIPDAEAWEFLDHSAELSLYRYIDTIVRDTEVMRTFGDLQAPRVVYNDLQQELDARISALDARQASGKITKEAADKERATLRRDAENQKRIFQAVFNHVRGVNDAPKNPAYAGLRATGKILRDWNFVRLMGSVLISSLPDIGRVMMTQGVARSFGSLFADMTTGFKATRITVKEAQVYGGALEMAMGLTSKARNDLATVSNRTTGVERFSSKLSDVFARSTGLLAWNQALKSWTSLVAVQRIREVSKAIRDGASVHPSDLRRMAVSRLSEDMMVRIADQLDQFEEDAGRGLFVARTDRWTDREAADALGYAIVNDADNTIITPGAADKFLWTQTEFGKMIAQFQGFGIASIHRVMVQSMQMRDASALLGVLASISLGTAATALRDISKTGEVKDRDVASWVRDGIDRSGVLSMYFTIEGTAETFGLPTPTGLVAGEPLSRYAGRNAASVFGPTIGLVKDVGDAIGNGLRGEFSQADLDRFINLAPWQNYLFSQYLLDQASKGAGEAVGLTQKPGA